MVCGDGIPVSGLLTVFRNVVELGIELGYVDGPVPVNFGYSWRPDKSSYYPYGPTDPHLPEWMTPALAPPIDDFEEQGVELLSIRRAVAVADNFDGARKEQLRARIEQVSKRFEQYFRDWLVKEDVDWLWACNMTHSDAAPVTLALHRAAAEHWQSRRGGVLFWDHDLFGSYATTDGRDQIYPPHPNEFTPVPGTHPSHMWAVVSEQMKIEAKSYPTDLAPLYAPNVLPRRSEVSGTDERHAKFLAQLRVPPGTPVILCPVRVFRVKGVEIALRLLLATREAGNHHEVPPPVLLVFGALDEDPSYGREVLRTVAELGLENAVHFLDGVPLTSHLDSSDRWRLDEIDLLHICAETRGGIFFTPNRYDSESVGLGPALAAVAGVPCASTAYDAFDGVYGNELVQVSFNLDQVSDAGVEFAELLSLFRAGDPATLAALSRSNGIVRGRFDPATWTALLTQMSDAVNGSFPARSST